MILYQIPLASEAGKCYNVRLMPITYDLIVPLGYACSSSQTLRRAGLQLASFPWDWVGVPPPSERCKLICEGFKDWMNLEDLKWIGKNDTYGHEEVHNTRTGLIILHDFKPGVPIEEQYPAIAAKYERRIARLDKLLKSSRRVLLVSIDAPVTPAPIPPDDCRKAVETMSAAYPNAEFDFLLVNLESGRTERERIDETPLPNVRRIAFDYAIHTPGAPAYAVDIDGLAALLAREYRVRDYRTKEELAAYKEKKRERRRKRAAAKWDKLGATNAFEYALFRVRRAVRKALTVVGPRQLVARLRQKRFEQIASMGVNCEIGFRFYRKWGFVDSSPFVWAQSIDIANLTAALRNLDSYCAGEVVYDEKNMWQCRNTGIWMHGQLKLRIGDPRPSDDLLAKDLENLRGRMAHLKEKLRRYISNDTPTLLVHRLLAADQAAEDLPERVSAFEKAVADLGARNCKFLFIYERRRPCNLAETENRYVRSVRAFNRGDRITWEDLGDPVGWNAVFTEFAPATILPKAHSFKFE